MIPSAVVEKVVELDLTFTVSRSEDGQIKLRLESDKSNIEPIEEKVSKRKVNTSILPSVMRTMMKRMEIKLSNAK